VAGKVDKEISSGVRFARRPDRKCQGEKHRCETPRRISRSLHREKKVVDLRKKCGRISRPVAHTGFSVLARFIRALRSIATRKSSLFPSVLPNSLNDSKDLNHLSALNGLNY
jgi:hypothetical protein